MYVCLFCSLNSYQNNATPLYVASQSGRHNVVQTLLGAGADVNIAKCVSHVMFYNYNHEMYRHGLNVCWYVVVPQGLNFNCIYLHDYIRYHPACDSRQTVHLDGPYVVSLYMCKYLLLLA